MILDSIEMSNPLKNFYHQARNRYNTVRFHQRQASLRKKIRKSARLHSKESSTVNKIGFYVYIENHLAHLLPITKHLPNECAEFITPEIQGIPNYFEKTELPVRTSLDILAASKKYRCVVSLFMFPPSWFEAEEISLVSDNENLGSVYFKRLGAKNVRMVYSLGAMPLNTTEVMKSYDSLFVYGLHEEKMYREQFGDTKDVCQVGYPKFDNYFSHEQPDVDCKDRLDSRLRTILWLPCKDLLSSIPKYLDTMLELTKDFNVILKPHPLENPRVLERVKNSSIILSEYHDSAPFYKLADFVFCDYGGSAFGAMYCDKPIVFLSPDNPERGLKKYSPNSPELGLREHFVTLTNEKPEEILRILQNSSFWSKDSKIRSKLRSRFFMNNYGESGKTAANHLQQKYIIKK